MMIYRNGANGVRCGNRSVHNDSIVYHQDAQAVYSCFLGDGTCEWLLNVGRDEDGEITVLECGAAVHATDDGWYCDAGHEHLTYGSEAQQAQERDEAMVEEMASRDPNIAARLDAGETWQDVMNS